MLVLLQWKMIANGSAHINRTHSKYTPCAECSYVNIFYSFLRLHATTANDTLRESFWLQTCKNKNMPNYDGISYINGSSNNRRKRVIPRNRLQAIPWVSMHELRVWLPFPHSAFFMSMSDHIKQKLMFQVHIRNIVLFAVLFVLFSLHSLYLQWGSKRNMLRRVNKKNRRRNTFHFFQYTNHRVE